MNYRLVAIILGIGIIVTMVILVPLVQNQSSSAEDIKNIHMVKTFSSISDPMLGHEPHEIVMLLPLEKGMMYSGTLTFSASAPVKVIVLNDLDESVIGSPNTLQGTIDGKKYAMSILLLGADNTETRVGSINFAGNAIELHSLNRIAFTVTASFDGKMQKVDNS